MIDFGERFRNGLDYYQFLEQYGTSEHQRRWQAVYDQVRLSESQQALLASFTRQMRVLCMAGAWCGDCVEQCPILQRFAEASERIQLRFIDRDMDEALQKELMICGGARVPVVVFLDEEDMFLGLYGDRTLAKYRDIVQKEFGPSCPTGISPDESLMSRVVQEWLDQFERFQWMLRTSARLRNKHGD